MTAKVYYLDKNFRILISTCLLCKHYIKPYRCKAFKKIPIKLWNVYYSHTKPYPGDKGIRFEKLSIEELKARYQEKN